MQDHPSNTSRIATWLVAAAVVTGVGLRCYTLGFFEFKRDQLQAIEGGIETRDRGFLVGHGMPSGVGLANPPGFYWAMGAFTAVTERPQLLAGVFVAGSIAALLFWVVMTRREMAADRWRIAAALAAISPPLVIYSSNIWAQSLMVLPVVVLTVALMRAVRTPSARAGWVVAWISFAVAAMLHLSAMFLLPAVLIATISRRASWKAWAPGAAVGVLLSLPYVIFLLGDQATTLPPRPPLTLAMWRMVYTFMIFHTHGFFSYYFAGDWLPVSSHHVGAAAAAVMTFFATVPAVLALAIGVGRYLWFVYRQRRLLSDSNRALDAMSWPVQVAGLLLVTIMGGYLLAGVWTFPHYCLVAAPAMLVLIADGLARLPRRIGVVVSCAAGASILVLLITTLTFIHDAGGHPHEYGPHAGLIGQWREALQARATQRGKDVQLNFTVGLRAGAKFDSSAIHALATPPRQHREAEQCVVEVKWNPERMRYEWKLEPAERGISPSRLPISADRSF